MPNLLKILKINLNDASRIAILAVGSEFRGDDAAGLLVAQKLEKKLTGNEIPSVKIFFGNTAPENLTGEIKEFKPSHIIIVDSAESGLEPGTIQFIDHNTVKGISFSTHKLPLKMMIDYFCNFFPCKIFIIGIQPANLDFGSPVSKEVKKTINEISRDLHKEITDIFKTEIH